MPYIVEVLGFDTCMVLGFFQLAILWNHVILLIWVVKTVTIGIINPKRNTPYKNVSNACNTLKAC